MKIPQMLKPLIAGLLAGVSIHFDTSAEQLVVVKGDKREAYDFRAIEEFINAGTATANEQV